jgi:N-acetylmuramoyl-L-alanine amidase
VSPETLFRPWYRAYEPHAEGSRRLAATIEAVLDSAIPSWAFPVQEAPMGVLASATMPAIALEVGNANNEGDMTSLSDPTFQTRIADAVAAAIEAYTRESS